MLTDEALVRSAKTGKQAAYAELVRRWSAPIFVICKAYVGCPHTAEDLAQETFLRGWNALETLEENQKFGAWLRTIARRGCLDWLKKKTNQTVPFSVVGGAIERGEAFADSSQSPEEEFWNKTDREQLQTSLESLPEEEREVLLLHSSGEWTYAQLAELLEIAVGTVNSRLARAREQVRNRMRLFRGAEQ